ncbi:MAG TPA: 16S rRNA (cytosine(1402)-N(4))-methyltransferase RsmH [Pirellulaceae bacterium]|nr:16S rRNA (cytosine(1402)-N(4))-methyltransferase RsmH [Pirellulaceae bacterium]
MTVHVPVLVKEVLESLNPQAGQIVVDGTLGGGGHTRLLALHVMPGGYVIGVDRDELAIKNAAQNLQDLPVKLAQGNFADIPEILDAFGVTKVSSVLLDLGLSSDQLQDEGRGFSYHSQGDFDLRFDTSKGEPAWRLLNRLSEKHLADLIFHFGEERYSRRVAKTFVEHRRKGPLKRADEIAGLVRRVVPRAKNHSIDPATRTFQAFRIAVNEELKWIEVAIRRLSERLEVGGRIAIISFHSLEDRLVKTTFRESPLLRSLHSKPIRPSEAEIAANPRARSSRLRVAERI